MGPVTSVAIYVTIWWTVLFAVLPWGVQSHADAGIDKGDGGDPGAPVNPKLKQKFLITTAVSAGVWALIWLIVKFGLVKLPELPATY